MLELCYLDGALYLGFVSMNMCMMSVWVISLLRRVASDLAVFSDGRHIPEDTLDAFIVGLELAYRELVVLDTMSPMSTSQREACDIVRSSLVSLRAVQESNTYTAISRSRMFASPIHTGCVGRPCINVPMEQLVFLIEHNFSVPQISDMLGEDYP